MKRMTLVLAFVTATASAQQRHPGWSLGPPLPDAQPVVAESRYGGTYPAGSRIKDDQAPGGFGRCSNFPIDLGDREWGAKGAITLVAFPEEPIAYFKHQGVALRLFNRSGQTAAFEACDSCLYILQEAQDHTGRWREIEEPPCIICGNSLHRVFLLPNECWEFKARRYDGPVTTKIRFRLDPTGEKDTAKPIYSNEFVGKISRAQLRMTPSATEARRVFRSKDAKEAGVLETLIGLLDKDAGWGEVRRYGSPQQEAALRLAKFGPAAKDALPALRKALVDLNPTCRVAGAYALSKIEGRVDEAIRIYVSILHGPDDHRAHADAASRLADLGPQATDAVPALCKALSNGSDDARSGAAEALGKIRTQANVAVPALAAALTAENPTVRRRAIHSLQAYGADAKPAVPALHKALRDSDGSVRSAAAETLWNLECDIDAVMPTLNDLLEKDRSEYDRWFAAHALGKIGPAAKAAIPHLTASLTEKSVNLRVGAADALWKVTGQAEPALGTLIRIVKEESLESSDAHYAIRVLEQMGAHARGAVPTLRARSKTLDTGHSDRNLLETAIRAIESTPNPEKR